VNGRHLVQVDLMHERATCKLFGDHEWGGRAIKQVTGYCIQIIHDGGVLLDPYMVQIYLNVRNEMRIIASPNAQIKTIK
jgi:hypothetical protein